MSQNFIRTIGSVVLTCNFLGPEEPDGEECLNSWNSCATSVQHSSILDERAELRKQTIVK